MNMKKLLLVSGKTNFSNYVEMAITATITIIQPIFGVLSCVVLFVIANMISGVYTQYKTKTKDEGLKFLKLLDKTLRYICFVGIIYLADYFILSDIVKLFFDKVPFIITKVVALIIILIEIESMNENYKKITGNSFMETIRKLLKAGKDISKEVSNDVKEIKGNILN